MDRSPYLARFVALALVAAFATPLALAGDDAPSGPVMPPVLDPPPPMPPPVMDPPPAPAQPAAAIPGAQKPKAPPPVMATDEAAVAAIARFKEDFKAKGLKGDERRSQRDFAMATVSRLQHPLVVDALADVLKDSDAMVRMIAVAYLGQQTLSPGRAGVKIQAALKRYTNDDVFVMTALQSIGSLKFVGADEDIRALFKNQSWAVKKVAIRTAGQTGDMRLLKDLLALAGVNLPSDSEAKAAAAAAGAASGGESKTGAGNDSGGKEVVSEGYSWEGADVTVDTGTSGEADQKEAERQANEQVAQNKAEAEKAAGASASNNPSSGGGTSGGSSGGGVGDGAGGGARGGGGASRNASELQPAILRALISITGKTFGGPREARQWYVLNLTPIEQAVTGYEAKEKAQRAAAK